MSHAKCQHKRGDWINEKGFWLCADCLGKMDTRPTRYVLSSGTPIDGTDGQVWLPPVRQEIAWQADIAAADGLTLNDFLRTMARRIMSRTRPRMDRDDAYDMAISILKTLGDAYGDPAYDWSHDGAREMADDEMTYWENVGAGGNT